MREKLASRLGFILLSAGCAIGLGNVWRFPYIVGQNGGGWFVLLYLFCLALVGFPILVMEFSAGRAAQRSVVKLHCALTPASRVWRLHGFAGFLGNLMLMMFYTTVTGWMVIYFLKTAGGAFAGMEPDAVGAAFNAMLGDAGTQILAMLAVTLGSATVCAIGLQRGLERISKVMMLFLLALIVVLAVHSVMLGGAMKGVAFYLVPDFGRMREVGVAKVVVEAMNHAFFTLSIGIGSMAIFGSYVDRRRTLTGEGLHVCVLDTLVALCAGLIIIPACFAFDVAPGQGPGLVFVTLPNVFNHMAGGRVWGTLFFVFMSFAALTTVLAVFENILACICDLTGWGRRRACIVLAVAIPLLSLPCIFGFNRWAAFRPFGPGSCVLDLEDFFVSNILLPIGGFLFALYCCHRYGWGWRSFLAEANAGSGPRLPEGGLAERVLRVYCAYVLPVIILGIFVLGLVSKFCG